MIDLKAKPFNLEDEQINWVQKMLSSMDDEKKIEQLFCPLLFSDDPGYLGMMVKKYNFGGLMFRPGKASEIKSAIEAINANSQIPLFLSANLEDGGSGISNEGTYVGRQMLIAATGKSERAYQLGQICGKEGKAIGLNLTFSPIVDIDMNYTNPITNVRTYGDDSKVVHEMAAEYIRGLEESDVMPTIKHFPGDGVDGRDQHLVTSVNTLTLDEWEASFGSIYRPLIDSGVPTVMIGHIAMPAMEEFYTKGKCNKVIPATLSKNIVSGYLRKELKFNGLVITDASPMVGLMAVSKREEAVPLTIENGCDMFLFTRDLEEDIQYMKAGYKNGLLSKKRLDEAVTRILALKAARILRDKNLEKNQKQYPLEVVGHPDHQLIAEQIADEGVTLVKDNDNLLPISPKEHKRVLLQILGNFDSNDRVYKHFESKLKSEGFEITKYIPETLETIFIHSQVREFKKKYDLVIYIGNIENASNQTVARIHWHTLFGAGNNLPWFAQEVPTLFISVGNPYHLYDVPMIQTYINAYCHAPTVIEAVLEKLLGKSSFKGKSPVDPFCGLWDARL
jgi:beta-N-acetylhexosaminidase